MEANKGSGATSQQISMELTAEGARVTSLSLSGSRLVLTIEAQLSDSQLNAGPDVPVPVAERNDAEPGVAAAIPEDEPRERERSNTDVIGALAREVAPDAMEDEILSVPEPEPLAADDESIVASISLEPAFQADEEGDAAREDSPAEPVRDMADAWDAPNESGRAAIVREDAVVDVSSAPPLEPATEVPDAWDKAAELLADVPDVPDQPNGNEAFFEEKNMEPPAEEPADETSGLPAMSDESSAFGGERHGEPQPALSFGVTEQPIQSEPSMPPAPEPEPEPELEPEPAPAPEPEPETRPEPEPDSATVLIRYTCPRCKTQGMQAVDKVGAVVNCSNCGKAMRLVMKK